MIFANFPDRDIFLSKIKQARNIVVTTHMGPDGDAIGSASALALTLQKLNPKVRIVVPNDFPSFLNWIPGHELILNYCTQKEIINQWMADTDLLFITDYHEGKRAGGFENVMTNTKATKIVIDHHVSNQLTEEYGLIDDEASAASELVYLFICNVINCQDLIDKDIATCLYAGIMTDTGCFSYNSSNSRLFRTVADLIEYGIDKDKIYSNVFYNYPPSRLKLLSYCFSTMKIFPEYGTAYMALPLSVQKQYGFSVGDAEGFVNEPFAISGIYCTAFFTEKEDKIKISFRSRGRFSVDKLARTYFNGGGHDNAAGAEAYGESLDKVIKQFEKIIPIEGSNIVKSLS